MYPKCAWLVRYGLAVLAMFLALLLRWALIPLIGSGTLYITVYPAIMIVAVSLGAAPGVFATVLGILLTEHFLVEPAGQFKLSLSLAVRSAILLPASLYVGWVSQRLRTAAEALKKLNEELEARVAERTAQLIRANEAVKAERQRFSDVLDMLPAYVVLLSPSYRVPFANRFFRERFGESHGKRCYEYLFKRTEPCENCETYKVLKTHAPHHWEWTGPDSRNYDIHDFPFADSDGSPLIMEMGIDITERKRAEEQVRRSAAELELKVAERTQQLQETNVELESFSYSVAHDLRTPIQKISLSLTLLHDAGARLNEEEKQCLQFIKDANDHMANLITVLLNLSKTTTSKLNREAVDLSALAQEIAAELRHAQPERGAEFIIAPGLSVHGDPRLLRIAVTNLLENAWKFTARRPVAKIEFGATDDARSAKGRVYFIRDNGVGFDMNRVDELFAPFRRLHKSGEFSGTGIGLASVRRIIHRHGGRIWAEAAPGKGATFYFTLGG